MTVSREEVDQRLRDQGLVPMADVFHKEGITQEFLAKQHKKALKSKETKFFKIKKGGKGEEEVLKQINEMINADKDPAEKKRKVKKYKVIVDTGEEMLVSVDVINHGLLLKEREDVQKLLGLYPAEKKELSGPGGGPIRVTELTDEQLYDIIKAGSGD